ncbi:MAG: carbohydrate binding domain-containing protein, partial [Armatimonadetes bacterium]|nr:carbohydrate binding domain-containing protein [Armatimonadota bacterium]
MRTCTMVGVFFMLSVVCHATDAVATLLPNGSFEEGVGTAPAGWTLVGKGEWINNPRVAHSGKRCVMVEGDGQSVMYWRTDASMIQPGRLYEFRFWHRADPNVTGGCLISGPSFANDDHGYTTQWQEARYVFLAPPKIPPEAYIRLGIWVTKGRVYFDDAALFATEVFHSTQGNIELGEGERIVGAEYTCSPDYWGYGNYYSRALADFSCGWNTNRWAFGPGSYVTYKHEIPGASIKTATVDINVNYHTAGQCVVEASNDGQNWHTVGTVATASGGKFSIPQEVLPAGVLYVRLRSPGQEEAREDSAPGSFQIDRYLFRATLDRDIGTFRGHTTYVTYEKTSDDLPVRITALGSGPGEHKARFQVTNRRSTTARLRAELVATLVTAGREEKFSGEAPVGPGKTSEIVVPWMVRDVGEYKIAFSVKEGPNTVSSGTAGGFTIPVVQDASYGYAIRSDEAADVWWCEGAWKVGLDRPAPEKKLAEMSVQAARGEFEPVQLVIRPKRELKGLTVRISDFRGQRASLPASIVTVKQVEYVEVTIPTDRFGCEGWWPDPLPPVRGPISAPAGRNLPLWLTVHAPRNARPGTYKATVTVSADRGFRIDVPLRLRVYNFEIPREVHLQTALGINAGDIWLYHNLTAPEDREAREKVWDLYMQNWRDHHISPFGFSLRPWKVNITGAYWQGGDLTSDGPHSGRQCMQISDPGPGNPASEHTQKLPIERGATYVLRFWARTATDGQEFMVTLGQNDETSQWLWGRNIDITLAGSTNWKEYEIKLPPDRFTDRTATVGLALRPSRWVEDGSTTGTTWYDDVFFGQEGGENLVEDPGFEVGWDRVQVEVDFSEWDRDAEKYLDGYGFNTFVIPIQGLGWGRYPNYDPGSFGPFTFGTPGYERLMGDYLMQIQNHLEEKDWLKKGFIYWYDEPEVNDYPFVVERNKLIKRLAPKLTRMLTEEPHPELTGDVDLWCPLLSAYVPKTCQERQAAGDRVWWYICCGPRAPFLGEFIDHPHTDMRAWPWATWKWRVEGCLIWTTT